MCISRDNPEFFTLVLLGIYLAILLNDLTLFQVDRVGQAFLHMMRSESYITWSVQSDPPLAFPFGAFSPCLLIMANGWWERHWHIYDTLLTAL